jgi:hypothetical protein
MATDEYLSGEKLYGDDFSFKQIQEWYIQESEAYAQMYGLKAQSETYNHHFIIYMVINI